MNIKLEYKEKTGIFHFQRNLEQEDSNGYQVIVSKIDHGVAMLFTEFIHKKYPDRIWVLQIEDVKNPLSRLVVMGEFHNWWSEKLWNELGLVDEYTKLGKNYTGPKLVDIEAINS